MSGIQIASHTAAEGGSTVGFIDSGDWISFTPYILSNATQFTARVSSAGAGGTIEVRAGSATGTLLGSVAVTSTGSWETFANVTANLANAPSGTTTLYLRFVGGAGNLFDVDAFTFATGSAPSNAFALRSRANNNYVTAGTSPLIANATSVGTAQLFDLIDLGGGNIALRARINNQYVCAENAGAASLIANRAAVGAWETFARINNSDGTISLRAQANGMYVVAENAGAAALIANRTAIGPWEKFDLIAQ